MKPESELWKVDAVSPDKLRAFGSVLDGDALRLVMQSVLSALDSKILYEFYRGRMQAKIDDPETATVSPALMRLVDDPPTASVEQTLRRVKAAHGITTPIISYDPALKELMALDEFDKFKRQIDSEIFSADDNTGAEAWVRALMDRRARSQVDISMALHNYRNTQSALVQSAL